MLYFFDIHFEFIEVLLTVCRYYYKAWGFPKIKTLIKSAWQLMKSAKDTRFNCD